MGTGTPNPFAIFVDVTFTGPSGQNYEVPVFYDDNGDGGIIPPAAKTTSSSSRGFEGFYRALILAHKRHKQSKEDHLDDPPYCAGHDGPKGALIIEGCPDRDDHCHKHPN